MSRFSTQVITGVGSYGLMYNAEHHGRKMTAHFAGNSFNAVARGTNFFDPNTNTGSNWVDVSSPITSAGIYHLPDYTYRALVFQVNSVAGTLAIAVG